MNESTARGKRRFVAAAVLFFIIFAFLFSAMLPVLAENASGKMKNFAKNAAPGAVIVFSEDDLSENTVSGDIPSGLMLAGLPSASVGQLMLGGRALMEGNIISSDEFALLTFVPAGDSEFRAAVCFVPLWSEGAFDAAAEPVTVTLNYFQSLNSPPAAAELTLETYSGMPIVVTLSAYDHDGDPLSYTLVSADAMGSLSFDGKELVFTPAEGKTGTAHFTYYAADSAGNTSAVTKASISIKKRKSEFTYADLSSPTSEYASVKLAQDGIFRGESFGDVNLLSGSASFSRAEFVALCMAALKAEPVSGVDFTAEGLSEWQSPYIAAALASGALDGNDFDAPVTGKSAAYIAVSLLREIHGFSSDSDTSADALAYGIVRSASLLEKELDREAALDIICRAASVSEGQRLGWKKIDAE